MRRTWAALVVAGLVAFGAAVATPAQAAAFRYWTYWTSADGGWVFSSLGPAFRPADERVIEGWRLAVTGVAATRPPRVDVADVHERACGDTAPAPDRLRIAVVLDYGTAADAPEGESPPVLSVACAVVPTGSTGFDALRAVSDIRSERGFVCGLDGYPATGCGRDAVEEPNDVEEPKTEPRATETATPDPRPAATASASPEPRRLPAGPPQRASSTRSAPESPSAPAASLAPPSDSPSPVVRTSSRANNASEAETTGSSSSTSPFLVIALVAGIAALIAVTVTRARRRR